MKRVLQMIIRRPLVCLCAVVAIGAAVVGFSSFAVDRVAQGKLYTDAAAVPHKRIGLLLGCSRQLSDGRMNIFFHNRILAAADLYKAGKVDNIIVATKMAVENHQTGSKTLFQIENIKINQGIKDSIFSIQNLEQ